MVPEPSAMPFMPSAFAGLLEPLDRRLKIGHRRPHAGAGTNPHDAITLTRQTCGRQTPSVALAIP
jgi:hypothetical protein